MSITEVDLSKTLENLENSLNTENYEAVQRFIDHNAAEGISEVRQNRHAQSLKSLIVNFAPEDFQLQDASEEELKTLVANLNRSEFADATKRTMRGTLKKFYKIENDGVHPEKVDFIDLTKKKETEVTRDDLLTKDELKQLFQSFSNTRDRALTMVLYESAARPGELLEASIGDFTSNGKGDFIFLKGLKGTPDRTNQLVRSGRTLREWLSQHPLGGELGNIDDPSAPLWVKTEQQSCARCGEIPHSHPENCDYKPDPADPLPYTSFYRRFKKACREAGLSENKTRPYNLRHTRLTEVATFMGYEQLNKFAGWVPGSDRAKVYVHLNNDDVNQSIREEYGISTDEEEDETTECSFCGAENQNGHTECRNCGRILSLRQESEKQEKQEVLERLRDFEEKGVLEKLDQLDGQN